jgi:alpha-amylase
VCDGNGAWCGGSLRGLLAQLDYIQGMGFDAVWITPVVEQLEGIDPNPTWGGSVAYHGCAPPRGSNMRRAHLAPRRPATD